jgi:hypothetical protein
MLDGPDAENVGSGPLFVWGFGSRQQAFTADAFKGKRDGDN